MLHLVLLSAVLTAQAADSGFSTERLTRLRRALALDVENKVIPGAVLLLQRNGRTVTIETPGFQDRRKQTPMKPDTVFRIASMTKPMVSVAAMMLAEEGLLDLAAPVARYLPEFRDVRVGPDRVAPKRAMTTLDLLRHTSGLTYGAFGNSPVDQLYRQAALFEAPSLEAMVKKLATLPLAHHPGDVWEYSLSTDVLGRVVEVVGGLPLDEFIAARITKPLRMKDTGFQIAEAGRLAKPDGAMAMATIDVTQRPAILAGGHGMLSTAPDYARFCQMLLNGGELEGVRLLSPHAVALMTADQLAPHVDRKTPVAYSLNAFGPLPEMGTSFGLGFGVRTSMGPNPVPGSPGDFSWSGISGTYFWVDPQERLIAVLMIQTPQATNVPYYRRIRTLVYQALVK